MPLRRIAVYPDTAELLLERNYSATHPGEYGPAWHGWFHAWTNAPVGGIPYALIEREDGTLTTEPYALVRFVDKAQPAHVHCNGCYEGQGLNGGNGTQRRTCPVHGDGPPPTPDPSTDPGTTR